VKHQVFLIMIALQASASLNLPAAAQDFKSGNHILKITRVRGWEAQLVDGAPNLGNFYWEPMTRKTICTTNRTGRQTNHIPLPTKTISLKAPQQAPQLPLRQIRQKTAVSLVYQSSANTSLAACELPMVHKMEGSSATVPSLDVTAQIMNPVSNQHSAGLVADAQLLKLGK